MSFRDFPGSSAGKESTCKAGGLGSIPGWEDPSKRERLPIPVFWPGEFRTDAEAEAVILWPPDAKN